MTPFFYHLALPVIYYRFSRCGMPAVQNSPMSCFRAYGIEQIRITGLFYSCLNASIGSRFAAFTDGSRPKITPISVENATERTVAGTLMATGT